MAAGVSETLHDMEWVVGLIDARAAKPNRPATYQKRRISNGDTTYRRHRFPPIIIQHAVWLYCRFTLSVNGGAK